MVDLSNHRLLHTTNCNGLLRLLIPYVDTEVSNDDYSSLNFFDYCSFYEVHKMAAMPRLSV